ncbi:MAG: nitroreductase [Legionellales bacterium RIFCSPHIGHO2_12_FULL_37_14]|nr:MAG: nitroreductase [Legionellales bacterium RIFCSPHIGHO2_12_FULL_37_14]
MSIKSAQTANPIDELLAERWSPRAFDVNKDISLDKLKSLLEAARWAPSCYGDQPWYYIVCHKSTNKKSWDLAFECLVPFNQNWVKNAPLILFSLAKHVFHHNEEPNRWAQHDTGAASENLCLQATSMGMFAHQMGGFDENAVINKFNVPAGFTPMAAIAVGYKTKSLVLPLDLQEQEEGARKRDPLSKHFFNGEWGVELE